MSRTLDWIWSFIVQASSQVSSKGKHLWQVRDYDDNMSTV